MTPPSIGMSRREPRPAWRRYGGRAAGGHTASKRRIVRTPRRREGGVEEQRAHHPRVLVGGVGLALRVALEQLAAFPVPRPSAAGVLARGKIILALRTALQAEAWGDLAAFCSCPAH